MCVCVCDATANLETKTDEESPSHHVLRHAYHMSVVKCFFYIFRFFWNWILFMLFREHIDLRVYIGPSIFREFDAQWTIEHCVVPTGICGPRARQRTSESLKMEPFFIFICARVCVRVCDVRIQIQIPRISGSRTRHEKNKISSNLLFLGRLGIMARNRFLCHLR